MGEFVQCRFDRVYIKNQRFRPIFNTDAFGISQHAHAIICCRARTRDYVDPGELYADPDLEIAMAVPYLQLRFRL